MIVLAMAALLAGFAGSANQVSAADDITIQFMASGPFSWNDSSITGHAFICIGLKVSMGIKEECFGFYPEENGKRAVYGPGCVDNELNGNVAIIRSRLSNVPVSVVAQAAGLKVPPVTTATTPAVYVQTLKDLNP